LLLVVLVTVAILALTVFSFASMMLVEEEAARVMTRRIQSKYLTASGVEYTRLYLAKSDDEIFESGGRWDNAGRFRGVPVVADVNDQGDEKSVGRFTLVAPNLNDGLLEGRRYGLVDESSKININALPYFDFYVENSGRDLLMSLPDMTEEIADAILDFVDADDEEREYGTESGYYNGLNPPYNAKNGPLDSLDELLLVNGITPELLFGLDINRNGVLDDEEASLGNVSLSDSDLFLGWANFLTLYSKETNLNPEGVPRVNINADDLDQLYDDLKSVFDDDWANFILLMRINGPSAVPDPESDTIVRGAAIPFEIPEDATGDNKFASVLDLMDQFVVTEDSEGNEVYVESPLTFIGMGPTLPLVMRSMTVYEGPSIPGRINLMQAPRRILEGVPGMTEDLLEEIIQRREYELDDPKFLDLNRNFETWILAEGLLGIGPEALERMKVLMPYLCAGGDVYRAEIVGYFGDGRGTSRSEVVFDTTVPVPKILLWRDKSHLQTGYSVEALGSELEAVGGNANGRN
jgi:hypothetical protein